MRFCPLRFDCWASALVRRVPRARLAVWIAGNVWHSMCDRLAEWVLTFWLLGWGWTLLDDRTFTNSTYAVLASWADVSTWACLCLIGGGARLALLFINGAWRRSPHFRILAAMATVPFWAAAAYGLWLSDTNPPSAIGYSVFVFAEFVSMHRAAKEAGWNDGRGRHRGYGE